MGKFGPKKSKMFVLSENWCTWYLKDANSYFEYQILIRQFFEYQILISFLDKFGPKK